VIVQACRAILEIERSHIVIVGCAKNETNWKMGFGRNGSVDIEFERESSVHQLTDYVRGVDAALSTTPTQHARILASSGLTMSLDDPMSAATPVTSGLEDSDRAFGPVRAWIEGNYALLALGVAVLGIVIAAVISLATPLICGTANSKPPASHKCRCAPNEWGAHAPSSESRSPAWHDLMSDD
jgi:hypothetical protein